MTATMPVELTRPNGKVWRGRLPIRFTEFCANGFTDETGFVVFGTHDIAYAATVLGDERMFEYCLTRDRAERHWWRTVPWSSEGYDFSYIEDPERGTPCVVFAP